MTNKMGKAKLKKNNNNKTNNNDDLIRKNFKSSLLYMVKAINKIGNSCEQLARTSCDCDGVKL